jgi:hypothetical protein
MKIPSADNTCWITIQVPDSASGYAGFEVLTHVDIGHGQFEARNMDIHFINFEEFVGEFDRFIMDRHRLPRLEGTYDTYIGFSGSGTAVICEYRLGDAFAGRKTARFFQSGEFEIEQERLLEFFHGFQELLAQQRL